MEIIGKRENVKQIYFEKEQECILYDLSKRRLTAGDLKHFNKVVWKGSGIQLDEEIRELAKLEGWLVRKWKRFKKFCPMQQRQMCTKGILKKTFEQKNHRALSITSILANALSTNQLTEGKGKGEN